VTDDQTPTPLGSYLSGRVEHSGDAVFVSLAGEFDMAAAQPLASLLIEVEAAGPRAVVIDLTDVTFLDSHAVRVIIDAHERSLGERILAVIPGTGPARRSLGVMGIDQLVTVIASRDDLDEVWDADDADRDGDRLPGR
jgi:anti-sigma B factor antagonist